MPSGLCLFYSFVSGGSGVGAKTAGTKIIHSLQIKTVSAGKSYQQQPKNAVNLLIIKQI
jgi:cytidylate kinase